MKKILFDFFPLLLFFGAYQWSKDMFVAIGVAIVASIVQVLWLAVRRQKIEKMYWIQLAAIVVLGGSTIVLQDQVFIRWKPTVVYWIFAAILFATQFIGDRTAAERLLGKQLVLPGQVWRKMNLSFAAFCLAMGFLNLYVAFYYGSDLDPKVQEEHWVNFKVFGTLILTFVFMFAVMFILGVSKHLKVEESEGSS